MRTAPLSLARSGSQREVDGGSVLALSSLCSPVLSIGAVGLQVRGASRRNARETVPVPHVSMPAKLGVSLRGAA